MKHLKKILILMIACIGILGIVHSGPLGVDTINVESENTLKVTLSDNPNLKVGTLDAEVTILHDVKLRGGFLNDESSNEVELLLENALRPNTSYSLLTVLGTEGSIDFVTPEGVEGFTVDNLSSISGQDIESIEVVDDRTIMVTYNEDLTSSTYEYKLLAESNVTKVEKESYDVPELTISVEPPFIADQDYILMFIEMQDIDGNFIEFDTGIYDFSTPVDLATESEENETPVEEENMEDIIPEDNQEEVETPIDDPEAMEEENEATETTETAQTGEDELEEELNAAGPEDGETAETQEVTNDTETVAMEADSTPETGAETWVLVALTLIINTFFYSARRKRMQLA